ncbi:heavy metal-associated isoprenylated plant protein 7-like isoform X1 [Iris pallida]|uniref:Heavy metal-associated isoprenylated plant protein 7-like isoform X1 n=1 Tax=Iris pallida TaxID=29817 RepID=A0AAX6E8C7_IRIPA|nr:heavy metal-associated isoprenylated plant protein 7-like isoform X1 [Iris pallida]
MGEVSDLSNPASKISSYSKEQKQEEKKEEKKEDEKKEEEPPEIVLKVDMHCEGCARKVERSLRKFEGVQEVKTDSKVRKVVIKGKGVDPIKLCERVHKKTGKKAEVISPLPQPPVEEAKDPPPEEKKEEPKPITVVLKVRMHCEKCAQVLQKRIKKMDGVETVVTDLSNDQIIVTGLIDPIKLVENVYQRTRRQASIVQDEEKKEEENKDEEKNAKKPEEEKKEEEAKGEEDKTMEAMKMEYWGPRYQIEYAYDYPPQAFSDENPNACSIM